MRLKITSNHNQKGESNISYLIDREFDIEVIEIRNGKIEGTYITWGQNILGATGLFYLHSNEYEIVDGNLGDTRFDILD